MMKMMMARVIKNTVEMPSSRYTIVARAAAMAAWLLGIPPEVISVKRRK